MRHLLKYTNEAIGSGLQRAIGTIMSGSLYKKSDGFIALSGKEEWNNTDFVCQSNPVLPCLFDLRNVMWDEVDIYTLNTSDPNPVVRVCGGYVLGDFADVLFPVYNPNQDNIITDVFASSIASLLKGDYSSCYAYLRFGQLLKTFADENKDFIPQTDGNKRSFNHALFKL